MDIRNAILKFNNKICTSEKNQIRSTWSNSYIKNRFKQSKQYQGIVSTRQSDEGSTVQTSY